VRSALIAGVAAALLLAAPALAQTPTATASATLPSVLPVMPMPQRTHAPHPRPRHSPSPAPKATMFMTLTNPGARGSINGGSCANRPAVSTNNPITGQPQAQTIVSVPLTPGSGSVADATTRSQQAAACAQGH
jgi:hypothetical protein